MPEIVDLVIEDERWEEDWLKPLCEKAVELALQVAGINTRDLEITVLACDDARISTLNSEFRGKDKATNVLSWPALDLFANSPGGKPSTDIPSDPFGPSSLGDIAIAWETVVEEARAADIPMEHHVVHLISHACLHLLGYDHQTDEDADLMEGLEITALASAGIASPY